MNEVSGESNPAPPSRGTHTPTPWAVRDSHAELAALGLKKESDWVEITANEHIIASCYMRDEAGNEANAAFIVRAVNNHDALVKALGYAVGEMEETLKCWGAGFNLAGENVEGLRGAARIARATLTNATGA